MSKPATAAAIGPVDNIHWGQVFLSPFAYGVVEVASAGAQAQGIAILSQMSHELAKSPSRPVDVGQILRLISGSYKTVALVIPDGHMVHIGLRGQGAIYLKRGSQIAALVTSSGVLSGDVLAGDVIILVTQSADSVITRQQLLKALDARPIIETAESLTLLLHDKPAGCGGAVMLVQIGELPKPTTRDPSAYKFAKIGVWRHKFVSWVRVNRKVIATILIGGFFIFSVGIGVYKQVTDRYVQQINSTLSQADGVVAEGKALKGLNMVKSRERMTQALALVEPLVKTTSSNSVIGKKVLASYKLIQVEMHDVMNIYEMEPELFFDAGLVKKGADISSISLADGLLVLLDQLTHTVYTLVPNSKTAEVIGGGAGFESMLSASGHGANVYVLTETGITKIRLDDKKSVFDLIKKTAEWGSVKNLVSFGGNLYLLDTQKNRIWKYVATETGFTDMREYLNPDAFADFTDATGLSIDGTVWVGTKHGAVQHFIQGRAETFFPKGVDPLLGQQLTVYADDVAKYVYVLDEENKRVVLLDKNGLYFAEYLWKGEFKPSGIVVSEELGKIFLLIDGKLYSIAMKL